jgi:hypothetical protein
MPSQRAAPVLLVANSARDGIEVSRGNQQRRTVVAIKR